MEFRLFQIIVPLIAAMFAYLQLRSYYAGRSTIYETWLLILFWISVLTIALIPDFVSNIIAKVFGIKDNVNALIFSALAALFYIQFKLYKIMKRQDNLITKLARKIALDNAEEQ